MLCSSALLSPSLLAFSQFSQRHSFTHTPPTTAMRIALVRAMLIYLYRQVPSLFPTRCSEHRCREGSSHTSNHLHHGGVLIPSKPGLVYAQYKVQTVPHCWATREHTEVLQAVWIWSFLKHVWVYKWNPVHFSIQEIMELGKKKTSSNLPQKILRCVPTNWLVQDSSSNVLGFYFPPYLILWVQGVILFLHSVNWSPSSASSSSSAWPSTRSRGAWERLMRHHQKQLEIAQTPLPRQALTL